MFTTTIKQRTRLSSRISLAASVAAVGLWAAPAGAAGPPVERFDGIYATCDGLGEICAVSLSANERAEWVPAFSLDGGQVLVPVSYEYRLTFTPHRWHTADSGEVRLAQCAGQRDDRPVRCQCHSDKC